MTGRGGDVGEGGGRVAEGGDVVEAELETEGDEVIQMNHHVGDLDDRSRVVVRMSSTCMSSGASSSETGDSGGGRGGGGRILRQYPDYLQRIVNVPSTYFGIVGKGTYRGICKQWGRYINTQGERVCGYYVHFDAGDKWWMLEKDVHTYSVSN